MQEEVTQKTIALYVKVGKGAARLTEQALQKAIQKFLEQKSKPAHGKQTMRQLMKQINYKKLILPNIPYVFFVYLFDKVGQAVRLAPGADISAKILNITQGFSAAFENALPSVYPLDLLVGIVGAVIIRLIVYVKGKNAKKYNIDFSLKKVKGEQTRYLVFFKGRDADVMTAAFQEFSAKKLNREKKPSIRKALAAAKDKAKQLNAARDKVKKMDRGREI